MVVAHHATSGWSSKFSRDGTWWGGTSGVDIFFAISGFVMAISYVRETSPSPSRYFIARIIRVAPLYWILTVLMLLKMSLFRLHPGLGDPAANTFTISSVLHSLLFIPMASHPIIMQGWTLNFEMFFYLLFALSLFVGPSGIKRFLVPALALCALLGFLRNDSWPGFTTIMDPLMLEFAGGMAIGIVARSKFKAPLLLSSILGSGSLIFLFTLSRNLTHRIRVVEMGIPALLIVYATVRAEGAFFRLLPRWALELGNASYSLYLVHFFVVIGVVFLFKHMWVSPPEWGVVLASLVLSAALAIAVHRFLEKPITEFLMARIPARTPVPRPQIVGVVE